MVERARRSAFRFHSISLSQGDLEAIIAFCYAVANNKSKRKKYRNLSIRSLCLHAMPFEHHSCCLIVINARNVSNGNRLRDFFLIGLGIRCRLFSCGNRFCSSAFLLSLMSLARIDFSGIDERIAVGRKSNYDISWHCSRHSTSECINETCFFLRRSIRRKSIREVLAGLWSVYH